jgi:predicted esterase
MEERFLEVRRTARYFTLEPAGSRIDELWFVLHGYGQIASDFLMPFQRLPGSESRRVIAPEALNRFYLVAPKATGAAHRPVGATWMTRVDRVHEIEDYVAYLDQLYAHVTARIELGRAAVRVLGFSQGVATAARWAVLGQARIDQLICWGGTLPPDLDASRLSSRIAQPIRFVIGEKDEFLTAEMIAGEEERLRAAGQAYSVTRFPGGHALNRMALMELANQRPSR